jgi:spore coat protein U-like protein
MRKFLLTAALVAIAAPAWAGQTTGTLAVSATVTASCAVLTTPLAFGAYTGAQNDATATVTVSCQIPNVGFTVALDGGGSSAGGQRNMANATSLLPYNLFSDPGRLLAWPVAPAGISSATTTSGSAPFAGAVTVYGRIPLNQLVQDGTYSDVINITVTF